MRSPDGPTVSRRIRKSAPAALGVLFLVAVSGAIYEQIGRWRDPHRFRREGRLVSVGHLRLNIACTGQGRPIVVFDSGFGVPALGWAAVQPVVSKFTRACSYDRDAVVAAIRELRNETTSEHLTH